MIVVQILFLHINLGSSYLCVLPKTQLQPRGKAMQHTGQDQQPKP